MIEHVWLRHVCGVGVLLLLACVLVGATGSAAQAQGEGWTIECVGHNIY